MDAYAQAAAKSAVGVGAQAVAGPTVAEEGPVAEDQAAAAAAGCLRLS